MLTMNTTYLFIICAAGFVAFVGEAAHLLVSIRDRRRARRAYWLAVESLR